MMPHFKVLFELPHPPHKSKKDQFYTYSKKIPTNAPNPKGFLETSPDSYEIQNRGHVRNFNLRVPLLNRGSKLE